MFHFSLAALLLLVDVEMISTPPCEFFENVVLSFGFPVVVPSLGIVSIDTESVSALAGRPPL
ncbi:hypothetical protein A5N83_13875 [Rhodococcus sp. 1139]|nr:hypothetical protein A5N83_13875 [Rhodococcus sp. 1139]